MNVRKSLALAAATVAFGSGLALAPAAHAAAPAAAPGGVSAAVFGCDYTTAKPTISYGSTGSAVKQAQCLLKYWGYSPGAVDGIFGTNTRSAVISFQTNVCDLDVDGIVGPNTWRALSTVGC
ncbi:peptidoglycan-binding domain-containing protein [Streptomyces sp. NPDC002588]|uniref:peptidoglycan-binding domain-containing protein n=1 Tax=Streptomyces sp. NPDC002588 TaxID=3154419 RepID=UPI00331AFD01